MRLFDNSARQPDRFREPSFGIDKIAKVENVDAPLTWEQAARLAGWTVPTFAGRDVTPESAMRTSVVYACVNLIAGIASSLPCPIFKPSDDGDQPQPGHAVSWLLNDEPCPGMTSAVWWAYMITSELLSGDAMAHIERDRNGQPLRLWPMNRRTTSVLRDPDDGALIYATTNWKGQTVNLSADDVLHVPGPGFDGTKGMSVIGWAARQGTGIAMAAEEYAGRFFANGARPDFALKYPKRMGKDEKETLIDYYLKKHQGLEAAHLPLVLSEGGDVTQLTLTPADSQLLDVRKFQVVDICRAFGVPPILVGDSEKTSSWGTGIEQVILGFVKFRILPLLIKYTDEINLKILTSRLYRRQDFYARHDYDELLKGDSKAQSEWVRALVGGPSSGPGIITPNEGRRRFGYPKRENDPTADRLFDPASLQKGKPNEAAPAA